MAWVDSGHDSDSELRFKANLALDLVIVSLVDQVGGILARSPIAPDRQSCPGSLATCSGQRTWFGGTGSCSLLNQEKWSLMEGKWCGQRGWCLLGLVGVAEVAGAVGLVGGFVAVAVLEAIGVVERGKTDYCLEQTRQELRTEVVRLPT